MAVQRIIEGGLYHRFAVQIHLTSTAYIYGSRSEGLAGEKLKLLQWKRAERKTRPIHNMTAGANRLSLVGTSSVLSQSRHSVVTTAAEAGKGNVCRQASPDDEQLRPSADKLYRIAETDIPYKSPDVLDKLPPIHCSRLSVHNLNR